MKIRYRFALIAVVLGGSWYGERRLESHLSGCPPEIRVTPPALVSLPKSLGAWQGEDEGLGDSPLERDRRQADEHLSRNYFRSNTGQVATVHLRFFSTGTLPPPAAEELAAVRIDSSASEPFGDDQANGELRGRAGMRGRWVYRRQFPLPIADDPHCDALQNMARRARSPAPTVTLEIFVPENFPTDPQATEEFVRLVDSAVESLLAVDTAGVDRAPIIAALFSN